MTQAQATIGILGGSGLYHMDALEDVEELHLKTPFGDPSDAIILGTLDGARVAFWRDMVADTTCCRQNYPIAPISTR